MTIPHTVITNELHS